MEGKKKGLIITIIVLATCIVLATAVVGVMLVIKGNSLATTSDTDEVEQETVENDKYEDESDIEEEEKSEESEKETEEEPVEEVEQELDQDAVLSKFVGYWLWDEESNIMGYCVGSGHNGIDISACGKGGAVYGDEEAEYEFLITRGPVWTDTDLVSFSENELVFVDDYGVEYVLTYLDEKTIQIVTDGSVPEVAVNSAYVDNTGYDLEAEIEQIQTWYYDTQSKLEVFTLVPQNEYVDFVYDGTKLVKIAVKGGFDGWDMAREYYFHEGQLYFMFAYNDMGEHRIYVKDNILLRYIDIEGISYDIGYGMPPEAWEVSEKGFEEAEALR